MTASIHPSAKGHVSAAVTSNQDGLGNYDVLKIRAGADEVNIFLTREQLIGITGDIIAATARIEAEPETVAA